MPIYDQGYRRWEGRYEPRGVRWLIIAQDSLRHVFRGKPIKVLLGIGMLVFLMWTARLYISVNFDTLVERLPFLPHVEPIREALTTINARFYGDFMRIECGFVVFIVFIAGSALIADDRRNRALSLYLSKPLSRVDYLFGKGAGVAMPIACLTLVPCLLLYLLHAMFTDRWSLLFRNAEILTAILVYSMILMISGTVVILAISSLTKQGRYASLGYIVLVVGAPILQSILQETLRRTPLEGSLGSPNLKMISLVSVWQRLQIALFDMELTREYRGFGTGWAVVGLVLFIGVSLWILHKRVRALDIVE